MEIHFKKLDNRARIPTKTRTTDEGYDLYALEGYIIKPQSVCVVKTGIAGMCDDSHWLQVEGRSGLAAKGVFPIAGIVDQGYSGEICVVLVNMNPSGYSINQYDRIAQLIIRDRHDAKIVEVLQFGKTDRGEKGFGSSDN